MSKSDFSVSNDVSRVSALLPEGARIIEWKPLEADALQNSSNGHFPTHNLISASK